MIAYEKIYDISITLGPGSEPFPGDPPFVRGDLTALAAGDVANVSTFSMTAHSGTHLDLPGHFFPGLPAMDQVLLEKFILPAVVADCGAARQVDGDIIRSSGARKGEALLLRTTNSLSGLARSGRYSKEYVHLTLDAAAACTELGLALLGIDGFSVDVHGNEDYPVHKVILGAGLLILERIDLLDVPPGRYTLLALPLKAAGAEASPVRAALLA